MGADITYLPMMRDVVYLLVVLGWASRWVVAWWLFNTSMADSCIETDQEGLASYGTPDIFNADQDCQFSPEFTKILKDQAIQISMDSTRRLTTTRQNRCTATT